MCVQKETTRKLDTVRDILEDKSRPPPEQDKTTEFRSIEQCLFITKQSRKLCASNRSLWVPKNAEFYADSKSEVKI